LTPDVTPIVVKCEQCGMELKRELTGWIHPLPVDPNSPHDPQPVPA
jgi:hypothetical protein